MPKNKDIMKNLVVRIFLASSIELQEDRVLFGDLIRRIDNMYEKQCIRIYLFKWEDFDAAYNNKVKQKEYDEEIRKCDVFVALFKNKAGAKTLEEFEEALSLLKSTEKPKIFVYCKNTKEKDEEKELKEFKKELSDKIGHYWETYDNADTLRFKFLYQLQLMIQLLVDKN